MPKIYLYAEILTHIRQLTLHASIDAVKKDAKLDVALDKKLITVTHEGETQKLYLPTQISGTAQVGFPTERKTEVSARIQIEDEHEWKCIINHEIEAPWMAADLNKRVAICCRECESSILSTETVKVWKDLPSEHWADLMDFWFCHKPHDEGQDDVEAAATAKGFSSRSKLAIAAGTGMTDLISVVLHADDCTNVKAAETQSKPDATVLRCSSCLTMLGTTSAEEDLIRLHKSSISMDSSGTSGVYEKFSSTIFTCAQILSLIEATALKKFVVHTVGSAEQDSKEREKCQPLILWIFNPDIYYSCSAYDGNNLLSKASAPETSEGSNQPKGNGDTHPNSAQPSDPNPHNDDTSNIYGETLSNTNTVQDSPAASLDKPQQAQPELHHEDESQPQTTDDSTQIYGQTDGPQFVSGEVEIEVPLPERVQDQTANTFTDIPVESIEETETPLITSKRPTTSTDPTKPTPSTPKPQENTTTPNVTPSQQPQHISQPSTTQTEHINLVHRAAKIFYKPLPSPETPTTFLDTPTNASTHEDLFLPNPADLMALRETLEKSTAMLPASARRFQDWDVGLLDRYEKVPSGLGVMAENPLARGISAKDGRVTRWDLGNGAEGLFS